MKPGMLYGLCAVLIVGAGAPALAAGASAFGTPALVKSEGVTARLESAGKPGDAGLRLTFEHGGAGEASAWVEWPVAQPAPAETRALVCAYAAKGTAPLSGVSCEMIEGDGAAWVARDYAPLSAGAWVPARFALARFARQGAAAAVPAAKVARVRVGFLCTGPASGELLLRDVAFTAEANRPPIPLTLGQGTGGEGAWAASGAPHSPTALALDVGAGPEGTPAARFSFEFAHGKYNYHWATVDTGRADTSGYVAVRFTYRTEVPEGFPPLNVMLRERGGGSYWVPEALPLAPGRFATVTVPFSRFSVPAWSKDPNGRLDEDLIEQVALGFATGNSGKGEVAVSDVVLVPAGW